MNELFNSILHISSYTCSFCNDWILGSFFNDSILDSQNFKNKEKL